MASSSGSLDTSANSYTNFTFPTHPFMTTSFSDLLASPIDENINSNNKPRGGGGLSDRIAERTGSGVPKFKSTPPPSLPLSPPIFSPSSYFAIPPGLSPAELLDSPVLVDSSNVSFTWSSSSPSLFFLLLFGLVLTVFGCWENFEQRKKNYSFEVFFFLLFVVSNRGIDHDMTWVDLLISSSLFNGFDVKQEN